MWFFQDLYVSHPSSITLTQWKSLKSEWLSAFFPYLEWGIGLTYPSLALHDFPVAHWCSIWTSNQKVKSSTPVRWEYLHGVPKDRSSNFMHYNFWSRLYFYVKFLEDVYFPIEYMYSESQLLACPFFVFFLSLSIAVAASSGIQRVDPQMIHLELFYHLVRRSQFNPQTIFV